MKKMLSPRPLQAFVSCRVRADLGNLTEERFPNESIYLPQHRPSTYGS